MQNRQSPIHHWLEAREPDWRLVCDCSTAIRFQTDAAELAAMSSLGLCDLSYLTKLGVKGSVAESWLEEQDIAVPPAIYESRPLKSDGLIVRFATDEFFLESGIDGGFLAELSSRLDSRQDHVFRVEHQEATFLLTGSRATEVLAQTCGINFGEMAQRQVIFTRVAGVSCGVFPDSVREIETYRFWVDFSYAEYLWETLVEITESLDGNVIGAGCIFPELQA